MERRPDKNSERTFQILTISGALLIVALVAMALISRHSLSTSSAIPSASRISNSSYPQLYIKVLSKVSSSGIKYAYLGSSNDMMQFKVGNGTSPETATYLLVSFYPSAEHAVGAFGYSNSSATTYYTSNGITLASRTATSDSTRFYVTSFTMPIILNGTEITANFEAFALANSTSQFCQVGNPDSGKVLCAAEKLAVS